MPPKRHANKRKRSEAGVDRKESREAGVEREESRDMAVREQDGREQDHGNGHSSSLEGHGSGDNFTQECSTARSGGGGDAGGRRDTVTASNAMANPRDGRPDSDDLPSLLLRRRHCQPVCLCKLCLSIHTLTLSGKWQECRRPSTSPRQEHCMY